MYNCKHCGAPLKDSDYECPYCGAVINEEASHKAAQESEKRKRLENLPKIKYVALSTVILLSIFTLGLYTIYWLLTRRKTIDSLVPNKKFSNILWLWLAIFAVSIFIDTFGGLTNIVSFGLNVYMVFTIRSILRHYALLYFKDASSGKITRLIAPSGVLLFFFGVIYLQYTINKMIDMEMFEADI